MHVCRLSQINVGDLVARDIIVSQSEITTQRMLWPAPGQPALGQEKLIKRFWI